MLEDKRVPERRANPNVFCTGRRNVICVSRCILMPFSEHLFAGDGVRAVCALLHTHQSQRPWLQQPEDQLDWFSCV